MTLGVNAGGAATDATVARGGLRVDRIVIGLLVGAAGVAWLLDEAGVSVPWRLFPSAALIVVGLALAVTLLGGRGRGVLIGLGIVLLTVAVAVGIGADRYAGPAGDRVLVPAAADWPIHERFSAGTVTVDLTRHPLPEVGTLEVDVGAGRLIVLLPPERTTQIHASVTAGTITVDGAKVDDGIDLQWSNPGTTAPSVDVNVHVGLGDIEISHA